MRRCHAQKVLVAVFVLLVPGVGQAGKGRAAVGIEEALCNTLAAEPRDPKRRPGIVGVAWRDVNAAKAIPACRMAVAVAPGDARLQFQLARALHKAGSEGNRPDAEEARALYRAAAEAGHISAMTNLGVMLSEGLGGARDSAEAVAWYRKAAAAGDVFAMNNLGGMLDGSRRAVAVKAVPLKPGDVSTKVFTTIISRTPAVPEALPSDDAEAVGWYRRAAEAGHLGAMRNLGLMLEMGRGTARDDAEAVRWYRKAAEAGDLGAMSRLGWMLASGHGTARDDVEALAWYRKAAEAGDSGAMLHLGDMLMAGQGAARDEIEGSAWRNRGLSKFAAEFTKTPIVPKPSPPRPPSP